MEESPHGSLYISNLPFNITEKELQEIFGGPNSGLIRVDLPRKFKGQHKGFAILEYSKFEKAEEIFNNFQGYQLYGRILFIRWDTLHSNTPNVENSNSDNNIGLDFSFPFDQYPEDAIPPSERDWERCYRHDIQFLKSNYFLPQ